MNHILSLVRRCIEDYEMIASGDRIAVGVSGGKDSLLLLAALARLREFYPIPYALEAITLTDSSGNGYTYFKVRDLGQALGFDVTWDSAAGAIVIDTTRPYSGT